MVELLLLFAAGFALNLAATPVARAVARRLRLVDHPDGRRKLQLSPVPLAGGPAVFASVAATVAAAFALAGPLGYGIDVRPEVMVGLLAAGMIVCGIGVVDDFVGVRGRYKLAGQCLAVAVVMLCGVQVSRVQLFGFDFELGLFGVPLTAFLLLGAINSLNLLDGMDGLLGGVGLIVCLTFGAMAAACGQPAAAWVAFALAGALLAFLVFNFPPASVYMGDSGSMLVGLVVGVLAIHGSLKGPATVALVTPMCVLIVPIFDTAAALTRRKLIGRSVFSTDRGHLHHCLMRKGLSRRAALAVVGAMCLAGTAGGLVSVASKSEVAAAIAAAAVVLTLIASRLFGYSEARLVLQKARYYAMHGLRALLGGRAAELVIQLQGTRDWRPVWDRLVAGTAPLQLRKVQLDIDDPAAGESFHARLSRGAEAKSEASRELRLLFPLEVRGRVVGRVAVLGDRAVAPLSLTMGEMSDLMHELEAITARMTDHPDRLSSATTETAEVPALPPLAAGAVAEGVS